MNRSYYSATIEEFCMASANEILGRVSAASEFPVEPNQRDAWIAQIKILKEVVFKFAGKVYFEYSIPRMGRRIDVVLLINSILFVIEFKVGEKEFHAYAIDQVMDYALDLKNFHESSHNLPIVPILVATHAECRDFQISTSPQNDQLYTPVCCSRTTLACVIDHALAFCGNAMIDALHWEAGRYCPTPTIVEAAMALYSGHTVEEISRSDASAINLSETSHAISEIIVTSRRDKRKSICFVTGVPGAGKTLVGLNIATSHIDKDSDLYSVFLSGNGPLVAILREALARDKVRRLKQTGEKPQKYVVMSEVKMFIQNVHNFRDACLVDDSPPVEHVALFDEAQRAWDKKQTSDFMRRKKHRPDFDQSEPEFLIQCLDRHADWAVVVCLVGGGQEINTGEAGIGEWVESLERSFRNWDIYISPNIADSEYAAGGALALLEKRPNVQHRQELHLSVSMRSFRAENVSLLVKQMLDLQPDKAAATHKLLEDKYPIVLTRDLAKAKLWLKGRARGSERYGIVVSSQAERLKPYAIDVRSPMDPVHWFLDGKDDVRSSYYLEDVATEFDVQGLELDWACINWDADFRFSDDGWEHWSFCGARWNHIKKSERKVYQKNAYRVLLTRARQGMVIVVPAGSSSDPTRFPVFYDKTFRYFQSIGLKVLE